MMLQTEWKENVILADADYVDRVAFDLIVNFERMLERRIPKADMTRWLECIALDGGMRPQTTAQTTQVVLLHEQHEMVNFQPGTMAELDGKAFNGELGEFQISCVAVEPLTTRDALFMDALDVVAGAPAVKRLMIVGGDHIYNNVRARMKQGAPQRHVTVFAMQPMPAGNFRQEILGYSLMAALGIRGEEIKG